jgi:uncharacterized protein (DUF302 family)
MSAYRIDTHSAFQPGAAERAGCDWPFAMVRVLLGRNIMFAKGKMIGSLTLLAFSLAAAAPLTDGPGDPEAVTDGIVTVRSAYALGETIDRLRQDITSKGITVFSAIDQSALAAQANIKLRPSTLLVFGNPALGAQFITSNPAAGLDWPVRLLVFQDESGAVWTAYTDFAWIARRHRIENREVAFSKVSEVIASITSSVKTK